tara:strand:+ start:421 stop:831 length:411 start_codon:yes stop_codon:yes gene_type:complete
MLDSKSNISKKIPTNKNFGYTFFIIFLIICLIDYINKGNLYFFWIFITLSLTVLIITIIKVDLLNYPKIYWHKFSIIVHIIFSPLIMGIIYFSVFLITGLLLKLFRVKLLNIKKEKNLRSYWLNRTKSPETMRYQF